MDVSEMDELKDSIETHIVTRTFNVSGMPESSFKIADQICKEQYGNCRWMMIMDGIKNTAEDFKYAMLYEEIQDLKAQLQELSNNKPEQKDVRKIKSFGQ